MMCNLVEMYAPLKGIPWSHFQGTKTIRAAGFRKSFVPTCQTTRVLMDFREKHQSEKKINANILLTKHNMCNIRY